MMLQHSGPSLADISCSALVPCLSPPGALTLADLSGLSPLVKEELRLAISTRRRSGGPGADVGSDGASSSSDRAPSGYAAKRELTTEEHERRKRRRERNKIAAAKCRNKKKEKTDSLQKESEKLESVNCELKSQISSLKQQKQQLVYMLNLHRPTCIVRAHNDGRTPDDERDLFMQHIKESALQLHSVSANAGAAPLDDALLTLDNVHCPGHL